MMQWRAIYKKELMEYSRTKKWIWMPLVFILLAIMDPITNYYLPQILDAVGGLPEGALFEMPEISGADAVMMSLGQLSSLGVLVIALSSMGTIAGEKKSGVLELILTKPISPFTYITGKWLTLLTIVWTSYLASMLFAWYYIGVLYEFIPIFDFLLVTFFYGLWLTLVSTLSIFYNAIVKSPGLVAFLTISTLMLMSLVTSLFNHKIKYSPNLISSYSQQLLKTGEIPSNIYGSALTTILLCMILIVASISIFRTKEYAA